MRTYASMQVALRFFNLVTSHPMRRKGTWCILAAHGVTGEQNACVRIHERSSALFNLVTSHAMRRKGARAWQTR